MPIWYVNYLAKIYLPDGVATDIVVGVSSLCHVVLDVTCTGPCGVVFLLPPSVSRFWPKNTSQNRTFINSFDTQAQSHKLIYEFEAYGADV